METPDSSSSRTTPPPLPNRKHRSLHFFAGLLGGNLGILFLYLLLGWIGGRLGSDYQAAAATLVIPSLLLVPFCGGLIAAWFWRTLELARGPDLAAGNDVVPR